MTQPRSLRLFIAIELPANVLAALNDVQHELRREPALSRLRWVRLEGIHLTLRFLGETPDDRQSKIEAAIAKAAAGIAPFGLRLGNLGKFGSRSAPRVVWVDVAGDTETLSRLQSQVDRELAPLGYPTDKRAFSPHLTLARVPEDQARDVAAPLDTALARVITPNATMTATEIVLMRSDLQRGGATYTQLFAAKLAP